MNKLVFGVDGGQTSTKCVLATTAGQVLARGEGSALIHLASQGGRECFTRALREAMTNAWTVAGLAPRAVEAIGLGLTAVEADTIEATTVRELLPTIVDARAVQVQSDAVAALEGAHLGKPGVIVIAGTGSIALGLDAHGQRTRAGGWGWLLGDEGSAMAIGRHGLAATLEAFDGAAPATRLEDSFARYFGISNMSDLKRVVYAPYFGQRGFASLAPIVSQAAAEGDVVAARIIGEAGCALAKIVAAVIRKLEFDAEVRVAPIGGAFEHVHGLRESFEAALRPESIAAVIVPPALPPVLGAVILALKECGVDLEQTTPRLQIATL